MRKKTGLLRNPAEVLFLFSYTRFPPPWYSGTKSIYVSSHSFTVKIAYKKKVKNFLHLYPQKFGRFTDVPRHRNGFSLIYFHRNRNNKQ